MIAPEWPYCLAAKGLLIPNFISNLEVLKRNADRTYNDNYNSCLDLNNFTREFIIEEF